MRQRRRSVARLLLQAILPVLIVVILSVLLIRQQGLTRSSEISAVVAAAVALLAWLMGDITSVKRKEPDHSLHTNPVDELANQVVSEWENYLADHGLHKPPLMNLTWSATEIRDARLSQHTAEKANDSNSESLSSVGNLQEITSIFLDLPRQRLIILGAPGSGKTVMAIHLTIDLIKRRQPDGIVPVLIPIASWNPRLADLNTWIVDRIAQTYYSDKIEVPIHLIRQRKIMPVLDGLDEIPEKLRAEALNAIDRSTYTESPVIITCRTEDYTTTIQSARSPLAHTMVVEIDAVSCQDAITYLRESSPHSPERWNQLAQYLSTNPSSITAETLRSPLMVYLTRTMFESSDTEPLELSNQKLFPSSIDIENYLLANYIKASYPNFPRRLGERTSPDNWDSAHAERWLQAFAAGLERDNKLELQWWRLSKTYMLVVTELINTVMIGLFAFGGWILFGSTFGRSHVGSKHAQLGQLPWEIYGLIFGLALVIVPVGTFRLATHGTVRTQRPGDRGLTLWHALAVSVIVIAVTIFIGNEIDSYGSAGAAGIILGSTCGYIMWVIEGGIARPQWRRVVASGALARMGCAGSLLLYLILVAVPFVLFSVIRSAWVAVPIYIPILLATGVLFGGKGTSSAVARGAPEPLMWQAAPVINDAMSSSYSMLMQIEDAKPEPARITDPISSVKRSFHAAVSDGVFVGAACMLATIAISGPRLSTGVAGVFAICAGIGSASGGLWGCFVVVRLLLWLGRKSPLRLMMFLEDATRRGILRQIGPVYVFRHSKVQKYLALRR